MSKIKSLLGAVGALVLVAGTASAADLGGSMKDGPAGYAPGFSWNGFYVGTHAGLSLGQAEGRVPGAPAYLGASSDIDLDGAIYGGQVGYNIQRGQYVFGLEGTFSGANIEGNSSCVYVLNCKKEIDWTASLVGRAGIAFDRTLVYSLAGVTWADIDSSVRIGSASLLSGGETHVGWIAGFGLEHALTDRISTKIEYTHADYGSETHNLSGIPSKVDAETDTIKLGFNIKLSN